jgi:hypothetical protein
MHHHPVEPPRLAQSPQAGYRPPPTWRWDLIINLAATGIGAFIGLILGAIFPIINRMILDNFNSVAFYTFMLGFIPAIISISLIANIRKITAHRKWMVILYSAGFLFMLTWSISITIALLYPKVMNTPCGYYGLRIDSVELNADDKGIGPNRTIRGSYDVQPPDKEVRIFLIIKNGTLLWPHDNVIFNSDKTWSANAHSINPNEYAAVVLLDDDAKKLTQFLLDNGRTRPDGDASYPMDFPVGFTECQRKPIPALAAPSPMPGAR